MGFLSKLEKLSEKYIEGFFREKFAGQLQPADITKSLAREMRDRKTVSFAHTYVPGEYTVFLSAADYENIGPIAASLAGEMAGFVAARAEEKGYVLAGGPKVDIESDEGLRSGQMRVVSRFGPLREADGVLEGETPARGKEPVAAGESTLVAARDRLARMTGAGPDFERTLARVAALQPKPVLVIKSGLKDAYNFPLGKHNVTIGRRRSNDLCLLDTGISREHARIEYKDGVYYLIDLGSTNGTFVNGARVSIRKIEPGDVIKLGATWLEFKVV